MTRKLRRAVPLLLILVLLLSLNVFAEDNRLPTHVEYKPAVSAVGIAGKPLSTLDLIGGLAYDQWDQLVPGLFVWGNPKQIMEPGIHEVSVKFQPTDSKNFAPCTFTVKVHAYKLNLTVKKLPTVEGKLAVNKPVSELTLKDGEAVNHFDKDRPAIAGHFEFVDGEQKFDKAGSYEVAVVFKPDESEIYNDATVTYKRDAYRNFKDAYVTVTVG